MSNHNYVESHLNGRGVTGWTMRCGVYRAMNVRKADRFGKSDPYAVVFVNGIRRAKSKVIKKSLNPHWEQVLEISLTKSDLGASSLQSSSLTVVLYDLDKVGTHDFLGAVELSGDDFMNFVAPPLNHLPPWELTDTSRIQEWPLANVEPHPTVVVRGKLAFWAEIKLDQESARLLAAIKIQSLKRGNDGRGVAAANSAARDIQKIRRAQAGRRKFEKTEFAYMAFSVACSHLKRWINWNNLTLEKVFQELDVDSSGELSMEEIRIFFKTHPSVDLSPNDIDAIIYHMDPDGDGVTTLGEFLDTIKYSDEVTDTIKYRWKTHLKQRDVMQRVRDMGKAWLKGSKNRNGDDNIAQTLQQGRRRRNSRWSAEFELMKSMAEKEHTSHVNRKMTEAERADSLHKGWRKESARRIQSHKARLKNLQLKLMKDHSAYLQRDDQNMEGGETYGLGDEGNDYDISQPQRPTGGNGTGSTSPNAARRNIKISFKNERPPSPTEVMRSFNYWERIIDKKTKRFFYCNCNTREVQWKLPEDGRIWPPPPPEEKEEEPRISPFAEFRKKELVPNNQSSGYNKASRRGFSDFGGDNSTNSSGPGLTSPTSPKTRKELDEIAYQMENFGSFRFEDLKIPIDVDYNENEYYYDNDPYSNSYSSFNSYGSPRGDVYGSSEGQQYGSGAMLANNTSPSVVSPKALHKQHTVERAQNRNAAIVVRQERHHHLEDRIQNRHTKHEIQDQRQRHMEDKLEQRKQTNQPDRQQIERPSPAVVVIETSKKVETKAEANVEKKQIDQPSPAVVVTESPKTTEPKPISKATEKKARDYLSSKGVEETKLAFTKMDTKGTGTLSKKKMQKLLLRLEIAEDELTSLFSRIDADGDGLISRDEYVNWVHGMDKITLSKKEEHLRPFLQLVQDELARESHHIAPTKPELSDMKAKFLQLAELIEDKATLEKHNLYKNVVKISENSEEKKVKKYATAVTAHWKGVFYDHEGE